jgi:hypothetical protein
MGMRNAVPMFAAAMIAVAVVGLACSQEVEEVPPEVVEVVEEAVVIEITSSAFTHGSSMPVQFSCDGDNVSPRLSWSDIPEGTKELAIIADDPDAPGGTWVHWVVYGISPDDDGLPEGLRSSETLDGGARQGKNDFDRLGYGGPCPPRGGPHRYFFKLYALDAELTLGPGATKAELFREMSGSILAQGELMGTYTRR